MQNQTHSKSNALVVLKEIQERGFLKHDIFLQYCQKLSHSFAVLLNQTPIPSAEAENYIELINSISVKNNAFYSLYQDTFLDLYDWADTGDEFLKTRADVQLLRFFKFEAPASVKLKKELLGRIKNMPRLNEKHSLLADVLHGMADHYVKNHQYNEDPNKMCLAEMGKVLNEISKPTKKMTHEEKVKFFSVADVIRTYAPEFYNEAWEGVFTPSVPKKTSVPNIKEAVEIWSPRNLTRVKSNHSHIWDRD